MVVFNNNIYIFGGFGRRQDNLQEIWYFSLAGGQEKWIQTTFSLPSKLAAFAYSNINENIYIFGGNKGSGRTNDFIQINLSQAGCLEKKSLSGNIPSPRYWLNGWIYNNNFIIFGGDSLNGNLNDLYSINLSSYKSKRINITNNIPSKRNAYSSIQKDSNVIIFGGFDGRKYLNDFYLLSLNSFQFNQLFLTNDFPTPRLFVY